MSQTVRQQRRIDFLRHIVNRVLASSDTPQQLIEDIKKAIGRAEDRYKFDAFSGDVRRLADYIRSREFNDLINIAKSVPKGIDVIIRILEEAKRAYSGIPEIVEAIEQRLNEIKSQTPKEEKPTAITLLKEKMELKGFKVSRIEEKEAIIEASKGKVRIKIYGLKQKDSKIAPELIEIRGLEVSNEDELVEKIARITE